VSCSKDPVIYTLTTSANPSDGGTISPSSGQFVEGETVLFTAIPANGQEFLNWSGDLTGTENSQSIVVAKDLNITANFTVKPQKSFSFENSNGLLISKAKTSSPNGFANSDYNAKLINFNGTLTDLQIPGSKSHSLNIIRAIELSEKYLLIFGTLNVEYYGDINGDGVIGDIIIYNNLLINTETGDFFEARNAFSQIKYDYGGGPWLNHTFQYDNNDNIYYGNQESLNSNSVQVVDKMNISETGEFATVSREKLNVISGNYRFKFIMGSEGDMLYRSLPEYNDFIYGFRNKSGKTYILNKEGEDPFVNNDATNQYSKWNSFFLTGKNGDILVFKNVINHYELFNIKEEDGKLKKDFIKKMDDITSRVFEGYDQAPMMFKRKIDDDKTNHIIINSNFGSEGTLITKITETNDLSETIMDSFFTENLTEQRYFTAYNNEAFCSTENEVLFAISQDILKIDFSNLNSDYLLRNSGYEFYKLAQASKELFYFYGLSYLNGKRTLGSFDYSGNIIIIEQFENDIDVIKIIKIGGKN
jgi:hypothetical protein